ncbi:hypothetical protein ACNOYE_32520 [Nannocystaceae bacterium ST9]
MTTPAKTQTKPRLPDRTGILIFPASMAIAGWVFAIVLAMDAIELSKGTYVQADHRGMREDLLSKMMAALAEALGLVGSLCVAAALAIGLGTWFARSVIHYRKRVAEDRKAFGLA